MRMGKCCAWLVICVAIVFGSTSTHAQSLIRDTEIETDLHDMATPIWQQAGLQPNNIRIVILQDSTLNAFVAGGQNIFLYTGLILDTHDIGELLGVIAHETGHITGGHLIRSRQNAENASVESILGGLAGIAAGVAAGDAGAGIAAISASQQMTMNRMLKNSRTYESSADQAGLSYLDGAGYSAQGTANFLARLANQEMLPDIQQSQYMQTHPLSSQRLDSVKAFVAHSRNSSKDYPASFVAMHARIKAKIQAFMNPQLAMQDFKDKDDFASRYGYAIALYRTSKVDDALRQLAILQKEHPDDGFIPEMRGQILFENGRIDEAIKAEETASALLPKADLIRLSLGQAYLESRDLRGNSKAIAVLNQARQTENRTPLLFRLLATAYGRDGQEGMAKLSLAEEALLKNDKSFATQQASAAQRQLPKTATASRQRAQDIIVFVQQSPTTKN